MTKEPTITVAGFSGDKQMTRNQFITQWRDHATQLHAIATDTGSLNMIKELISTTATLAAQRFDQLYEAQNK